MKHLLQIRMAFPAILWILLWFPLDLQAQLTKLFRKDSVDTDYYVLNDSLVNTRFYVSQKLTSPNIVGSSPEDVVKYRPNGNTNLGLGATYGWLTLNIGVAIGFMNDDNDEKGKTRFLDLHTQAIGRPYCVDLYGQFYYGNYLKPPKGTLPDGEKYVQRPDIYTQLIGGSVYYFPNWRRFSYAAAITQRDWQQKSAGSVIVGGEAFAGTIQGDSNMIPVHMLPDFPQGKVDRMKFLELGAGVGYAHTFVIKKHFFIAASAIISMSGGVQQQYDRGEKVSSLYLRPNYLIRPSIGYNSWKFNASAMFFASRVNTGDETGKYQITTSNLRFTLAYRFLPSPKTKRKINRILGINPFWKPEKT